jgi:hypothetical protein
MKKNDPLIEKERKILAVQNAILDALEPLSDEGRVRVMRAVSAYYAPIDPKMLDRIILDRAKLIADADAEEEKGEGDE